MSRPDKRKAARDSRINLIRQSVHPENCNHLNPTQLLDLRYSVAQFLPLDCGSIVVV